MPKFCRHWISNRLHRCERTRPETSTFIGVGSCTCDCTAGLSLLCHETGNGAFLKQMRQQTGYLTHKTFFVEELLLSCQSCTVLSQYTIIKLWRAWGSNVWTGCIKIDALQQRNRLQSPALYAGTRPAWWIVSKCKTLKCNFLVASRFYEATAVWGVVKFKGKKKRKRKKNNNRKAVIPRGNGDIIC